ncbi:MAG: AAA family ATPase [Leptolyngbyaceae cyanobacterium]
MTALGAEHLSWQVLWVWPVTLAFYYRLLPEYLIFAPVPVTPNLNFLTRTRFEDLTHRNFERWLRRLPPFSSELLWIPIPGHAKLLAQVWPHNPVLALNALQRMQASPLPGLTRTAKAALPEIIAGQLSNFDEVAQFQSLLPESDADTSDSNLRTLLPTYLDPSENRELANPNLQADLATIFPRLQNLAQSVVAASQNDNAVLRERGLERSLDQLRILRTQFPSLGLKTRDISRWQPVMNRWQNLLELELAEQRQQSQGELLNPFQYGNPLKRSQADLFKGRRDFANNLVRLLLDRNRPTIVLHGPRRCGKTSFLNNLPRLLPSDWVPIFVDLQSGAATANEVGFLRSVARAIRRDGRSQGITVPNEPNNEALQPAPYDVFETWLEQVLEQLGERQLLLNFDEFEKVGTAINAGRLNLTLFDELRSLIQHWDKLGFVFSGVQTLDELGPNWSSYFISVVPVEMLYLEPSEARDLLTNPDPEFALDYKPGLVDEILQLTQCHPNLLQLIGAALVSEANGQHTQTATAEMLEVAIPRAFTLGTSYFTNVWTEFTGQLTNPTEVQAGQRLLKALAEDVQPAADLDSTERAALRHMVRYHVLKIENGRYQFDIPLVKRWVKERTILSD